MKYIFIINPASGKTNYNLIKKNINEVMQDQDYLILETKKPYDATIMAKKYKDDENAVIYSVGGDGTLNEIVNGIALGKCKLGIIPTGSGNDFYKSLKSYSKKEASIDLGLINNRYFINISSVGIDAQICNNANHIKHKNKFAYYISIIKTLFTFKHQEYTVKIGDLVYQNKFTIAAICNGKYYGGGFKIAPLASFDDDVFDVYLVDYMNRFKMINLMIKLLKGTHEKSPLLEKIKATNLSIKSNQDIILNIDGEIIITKNINIKMIPNAIKIINDQNLTNKILKK